MGYVIISPGSAWHFVATGDPLPLMAQKCKPSNICTFIKSLAVKHPERGKSQAAALVPVAHKGSAAMISGVNIMADAPVPPPPAVARKLAEDRANCVAAGMTLTNADSAETAFPLIDLNGDLVRDWVAAPFCSPVETADGAEPAVSEPPSLDAMVFVSRAGDFIPAIKTSSSFAFSLEGLRPGLIVSDGQGCADGQSADCSVRRYLWNDASQSFVLAGR